MRSAVWLLLVLSVTLAAAAPIEVTVEGVRLDADSGTPVVRLVERIPSGKGAPRELPIWIGPFEAQAIALEIQGVPAPRPLTHDLMKQLVERLGGKLLRVVVGDLHDNTYFATLYLAAPGGKRLTVDARPSDAIALALRLKAPILVEEDLFSRAATQATPAAAHLWGLTLQDLTPELAALIDLGDAHGVLVSDVAATAPAREVARGDVIVALDDDRVVSVDDLTKRASARTPQSPVRLSVRRGEKELNVSFTP